MEPSNNIDILTDEELVSAIVKTNDTLLFGVLYDRFSHLVYNKCYGFAKDEDEAKDLTQDVFLKLFVKLASFKGKSKFSTWLYAFTYNHCVNYVTRNTAKKFEKQSVDYADIENISEDYDETSDFSDLRVDKLKKALELVSPDEKMILLLKYQDNLSIKEIESVLGVGQSAVKMRIKRAKDKLLTVYENNLK
ncbi:RNA polymerase sigma factor [Psychroserpens algicola]|uniref:Sigma-70 family RNA polymerase sigma factor n=1 Tax=Psychroserpens algicola TaxID=1719034 RepID=A0ABT0H9Z2_9FLAO|nr:sigma-70 family RNA polymerase sigma factor [Psychroserpens algicola]MCK8481186.1 sigma-70 family RNA polymerase sigma factor [Psychroserpens algicola]